MPSGWKKNVKSCGMGKGQGNGAGKGNIDLPRPKVSRKLPKGVDKFFGRERNHHYVNDDGRSGADNSDIMNDSDKLILEKKKQRHAKFVKSGQTVNVGKLESRGNLSKKNLEKTTHDRVQLHGELFENLNKRRTKYKKLEAHQSANMTLE